MLDSSYMRSLKMQQPINIEHKLSLITEQWQPKVIAEMNDYQFKVVKILGDFVWHAHPETDEVFIVIDGVLTIYFRDGEVAVNAGEMYVVPRGIEHKTYAQAEAKIMLIEPRGIVNTGHEGGERTAKNDVWI
ncbi:mannose-6-phosphate isomerase-like protein (cupin superfamily) [Raoultella ornithinolytica]|jgi:mannose-6-phosphate isomerase-like protein (cupin superfamily)|uniref:Mannose-6-phosphate isomerase-like protein (Cupin superfamily) n=2 Tax=Raoultella TaxID=160674 RepID=A0ABD7QQU5_RAOOR|nr:mannose-6-phosphate isomerase-like protein (cupin superfamily) [Raoultella ornithinolytica]